MAHRFRMTKGRPAPLGATYDGEGVNFAVYSEHASGMILCLFDDDGSECQIAFHDRRAHVWHGYVRGIRPGQRYGFRAKGKYEPREGFRFNSQKLLVDPYALSFDGRVDYLAPVFGYAGAPFPGFAGASGPPNQEQPDVRDSASGMPKSVVVDTSFDWQGDALVHVPAPSRVIYEAHVKGMTALHPEVPPAIRGTYTGMAHPAVLRHLKSLGVTTVELLPVQEHVDEWSVVARGMTNYWGYSTLGYFAPDQRFASVPGQQVVEFKAMVRAFHQAGIEVILDVVYNHTAEGDEWGPTLCYRGLDNATYYRLRREDRARYEDFSGCGNTLDARQPQVLKLMMDSLRYWVTHMHVDGFRFDLTSALARGSFDFDEASAFFKVVHQDPVLSHVLLIAEPWDVGAGGYQVGKFPAPWAEWNGRYRDVVRRFWAGSTPAHGELASRIAGSSDLYGPRQRGRGPHASVNFITAHDGFTLADLVTYEKKRNAANGESNRDGSDENDAWNCGVEGPTDDAAMRALRARQRRNLLVTLALSHGVPMLTSGDELGKTQGGNNNAYALDHPVSWNDWTLDVERAAFQTFTREIFALRKAIPSLNQEPFWSGGDGEDDPDVDWFHPAGRTMQSSDWEASTTRALGVLFAPSYFWILNGMREPVTFELPALHPDFRWVQRVDTQRDAVFEGDAHEGKTRVVLAAKSVLLFERRALTPQA
jgi:glycogen operon protein